MLFHNNNKSFDVTKDENKKKFIQYQYIATLTGSLAILSTGMTFGWVTTYLPSLLASDSKIPTSSSDGSWLVVMPCISSAIGCLSSASFVDRIGRKKSMLLVSPLYFLSWMLVGFGKSITVLNIARFVSGVADGVAFTVYPMYLGEIADAKVRGFLGSSIPVTTVLGFLLVSICGSYFTLLMTSLISSIVSILHFITFSFMPESPYYLLMNNKVDQAKEVLMQLRGHPDIDEELNRLERAVEEDNANKGNALDLFRTRSNLKGVFIAAGLRGLQQCCGPMAITFYATIIFHESGSTLSASSCTSIYFALQVTVSVICSCLVDKIGRRPLLILSTIGACAALAIEGSYFYIRDYTTLNMTNLTLIPVIALLMYNVLFYLGLGTIPVMMLSELFPTNVKAFALCLADIYFGLVVIFISKFFQIMTDSFGMHVPFFVFSICSALGFIFVLLYIPETKGKTLEEIQELFKGKLNNNNVNNVKNDDV